MKQTKFIIPLLFIINVIFLIPSQAQLLDKLKRAAKERLEDHAVDKVVEGVDKGVEKTEKVIWKSIMGGNKKSKNNKNGSQGSTENTEMDDSKTGVEDYDVEQIQTKIMSMMGGDAEKVETADRYSFTTEVVYKMEAIIDGKPTSMDYTMLLNPDEEYMATKIGSMMGQDGKKTKMAMNMTTIMDFQNNAMIMIMEEQKIAQIMSMSQINDMAENDEPQVETSITKTGRTKEILGYKCEEYQMTSEDMEGSIWIAPDIEVYNQSFLNNLGSSSFANKSELMDLKGLTMEMDMTIKSEKKKKKGGDMNMKMTVISFEEQNNEIAMANYKSLSLGGGFSNQGK